MRNRSLPAAVFSVAAMAATSQQPPEPVDIAPISGDVYYLVNQRSGMQAGVQGSSQPVQESRSFTDMGQRWTLTRVSGGAWQIANAATGLCLEASGHPAERGPHADVPGTPLPVVQMSCSSIEAQRWALSATRNGYYTITNQVTRLALDAGAALDQTPLSRRAPNQSQQWLLRPAYFRGFDNALLEKQEAARVAYGLPWWNDNGRTEDVLEMFKSHGINMVRLRPGSVPPYANVSAAGCAGNACYGETEAQDLDVAKRARNLGMSIELTLLFDGGRSASVPPAWTSDTELSQLQADLYAYVKSEILAYRQAGTMPDLVAIGNEVDTGFLAQIGSPTGQNFGGFAALQTTAAQAIKDAAADPSAGPPIPPPLTCIHITPAWDLTQFFTLANQFKVPYDAICQSYYPIYHGPLTDAQAAASNPNKQPVEQDVLTQAANNIAKPIFIIETGEHYANGFQANDPWYLPPTPASQRQFMLDLQTVVQGLPNNLGMGIAWWDPAGVDIHSASGQLINGDNLPDAIYVWNGLTLFDNTTASLLPAVDALGGNP
jgi:arabinogalactan endo-1,4-beta-galactosidase